MTDKLPTTSYIFVDRRATGRGKSLPNRQRLLRRIKDAIRESKPQDIDSGAIKNMGTSGGSLNPVKVTRQSLHEPTFHYAQASGKHDIVLIGNDKWERGDDFPLDGGDGDGEGGGPGQGGPGEDGEDDFIVNVSRDEFFDVFFEDCELPDLLDNHKKEIPEFIPKHAGFQKHGNPGQLSVKRSFKNSFARRRALTKDSRSELDELQAELDELMAEDYDVSALGSMDAWTTRVQTVTERLAELKQKISAIPFFEDLDLRYTKKEKVQVKSADAVLCMIMDISGSMDEDKKRMARKFFSMQYAFIKRKYPQTDLVFIAHTDTAEELNEEEFFSTRRTGGTVVSPAYTLLNQIVSARYDAKNTNLYLSQASDGDNWDSDNAAIPAELVESGLLSKLRFMSYAQVGPSISGWSYAGMTTLWGSIKTIADQHLNKIAMVKIQDDSEVFDAFHKIYRTGATKTRT